MCSACTSSSPSAVKSAAEQSARSLMFGLNAARCSTAPISSAIPVSREIKTWSDAGSRASFPALGPSTRACSGHTSLGSRLQVRGVTASFLLFARSCVRIQVPSGVGSAVQPSGTQTVQSGSAATAGPTTRSRLTAGSSDGSSGRGAAGTGAERDDLDRDARPRVAVAARVLGRELVDRRARSARGSGPRTDSRGTSRPRPAHPRAHRARSTSTRSAARAAAMPA